MLKSKCSVYILFFFYLAAGVNHFINPSFYLPLIPDYLPYHPTINIISGIAEIILAIAIHFRAIRKVTAYLLILMLVAFIPSHIYFIQEGSCIQSGLCVAEWIGWARLLVIHPLLIYWALMVGKSADK
ncbi:DoxX family protein [Marivirga lumbricoides]|uniref:DoxX family protein n=1 Tax=Marivirga lumbricoides TaxID=1046115 RepID=UPI001E36179F